MKTKLALTMGAIIAALLLLTGCNSDNPDRERETPYTQISMSDATRAVVAPSNDFALDLFRLAAAVNRGNIVISPISISQKNRSSPEQTKLHCSWDSSPAESWIPTNSQPTAPTPHSSKP